ncbi:MAG: alpha/beta hydrolase [Acidimicrobiia bacterium]|jgi:pimeloyl-ACP methyl ester carboxylesterase|nr:alpha/beta hydrolase [Acidimicrobiia bacterium]
MSRTRLAVAMGAGLTALVAGAGLAARRGIHRYVATERAVPDPVAADLDDVFDLEALGVTHHRLPTHDGGELHLVEKGPSDGRPLVLLHGITLAARVWGYQLRDLSDTFRVIAPDLRGHGESREGADAFGLDRLAHDLATVFDALDLRNAIVVGHSMGGMALMRFCADFPVVLDEQVEGVVFLATAPVLPLPVIAQRIVKRLAPIATWRGESRGWDRLPHWNWRDDDRTYFLVRRSFGTVANPSHVELTRQLVSEASVTTVWQSGIGIVSHDADDALAATKTPALVIGGERDNLMPIPLLRRIAELLPNAELHLLPDAGHQLMLERPDEIAALLRVFAVEIAEKGSERVAEEQDVTPV